MLRATDNKHIGLYTNDVKRLILTTVVEVGGYTIEGLMCVYDDFLLIDRIRRGDVVLWATNGLSTKMYAGRILSDMAKEPRNKDIQNRANDRGFRYHRIRV